MDGDITHETKTGYLSIPAAAWIPSKFTIKDEKYENTGKYIQLEGTDANFVDSIYFQTPVFLPDGVRVTELLAWVDAAIQNNLQLDLYSYENGPQLERNMAKIWSSDRTGLAHYHHDNNNTISDAIVDNASKAYYMTAFLIDSEDELVRLHTVRIAYTYNTPDK